MCIKSDNNFIYEDVLGHLFDEKDRKLIILHVGNVDVPLESCMSFRDFKLMTKNCKKLESKIKEHNQSSKIEIDPIQTKPKIKTLRYSFEIKQKFHDITVEEGFSAYSAANILGVLKQTVYTWKRKAPGSSNIKKLTTANHFFNFIRSVIEEIKSNEELKEMKYLIADNARIHKYEDISTLASNNKLRLLYLPPYSSALNAIEEFWSVCKSKIKPMELTVRSKLSSQVKEGCSQISIGSFRGFYKYSSENLQLCLER